MRIGWGITGSGHLLLETVEEMERIASKYEIYGFLSRAGERVVRVYGLWSRIQSLLQDRMVREEEQAPAFPLACRFSTGSWRALVVSPASANTVAKVVHGIADTLLTNAIAQAGKGGVPVIIVPTDLRAGKLRTRLPYSLDLSLCGCVECPPAKKCPAGAIKFSGQRSSLDLTKCEGCGLCLEACPRGAITFGKEIEIYVRPLDAENARKLRGIPNVTVLDSPHRISEVLHQLEEKIAP
ncbi:MAG: flavoprotein [Candidatus Hadarchaeales archaeon]